MHYYWKRTAFWVRMIVGYTFKNLIEPPELNCIILKIKNKKYNSEL